MKRGSTDVDWVIAIGIFITFLLSIFVFLKPGITPPHRPEALLDIVENNLRADIREKWSVQESGEYGGLYWTLYETPLYIGKGNPLAGTECVKIPFEYNWYSQDTKVNIYINEDKNTPLKFKIDSKSLYFQPIISTASKSTYVIHYSKDFIYNRAQDTELIVDETSVDPDADCVTVIEPIETTVTGDEKINFEYSYGVTESVKGISINIFNWAINEANQQNLNLYTELKEEYGFPQLKEFSVHIKNTEDQTATCDISTPTSIICDFQPVKPEVDANVFIREWSDFILNYNGLRDPVIVNIRVW